MRKLFLLAALLCRFTAAQAAGPMATEPAPPSQHPLTGIWTWTLPGSSCTETWHYRANGTRTATSGEELALSDYEVPARPSLPGFYRVVETVTSANGKPDCAGDVHEVSSDPVTRYLQFSPRLDQLIVCKAESLQACFGPLKRVPQ